VALLVTLILILSGSFATVAASSEGIQRGIDAQAARYQAMAEFYLARSEAVHSARWAALGDSFAQGYTALANNDHTANLAGYWAAMEGYEPRQSGAVTYTDVSRFFAERMRAQSGAVAESDRSADPAGYWAAMEGYEPRQSGAVTYTDVSRFFAERMRAQAGHGSGYLAINPELSLVVRYDQGNYLAENPELMVAGRYQGQTSAACAVDERLAANPELSAARRAADC
jgi:hypothetical protein